MSLPPEELARQTNEQRLSERRQEPLVPAPPGSVSVAKGSLSPDGRYRWDGRAWVPVPALLAPPKQQVFVSAGTAFKIGFFGFWGAAVASIVVWILAFIVLGACGAVIVGALRGSPSPP